MNYSLEQAIPILKRTPAVLQIFLGGLPDEWVRAADGPGTWSAYDVVGHLIHGERVNWIPRTRHILEKGDSEPIPTFDREEMFTASEGKSLAELLEQFEWFRAQNLETLQSFGLKPADLARRGVHPELGAVTLGNLLSTWVAHDLGHIRQIAQTMGRQYRDAMGPWTAYFSMFR